MYKKNKPFTAKRIICDGPGETKNCIKTNNGNIKKQNQPFVLKVLPTGVASVNINGRTIHSLSSLTVKKSKLKMKLKPPYATAKSKLYGILKNVQLLIIDEISMVDASMLYAVKYQINEALNCDSGIIFGNVNCLFIGDMLQLSPVKKLQENYRFL
uniref:ATP-dependent DNA helicase n=1 Tax=Strongyloides venezuelensis TaxID=75913 RepID=A0A0K0G3B3_STRVS